VIRLASLVTLVSACKAALDTARTDGDVAAAQVLESIGIAVSKLIGEHVTGKQHTEQVTS